MFATVLSNHIPNSLRDLCNDHRNKFITYVCSRTERPQDILWNDSHVLAYVLSEFKSYLSSIVIASFSSLELPAVSEYLAPLPIELPQNLSLETLRMEVFR